MLVRMWRSQNPHTLQVGIETGTVPVENTDNSSKSETQNYHSYTGTAKRNEDTCPHKNLYLYIHSILYNPI